MVTSTADRRRYILAVDLGTSGPKVGLVTTAGEIVGSEFEPVGLMLLPGGGAEQDPDEWWQAICRGARRVLAASAVPVDDVVAVNCTSQWAGTVAVDADGHPLMNAVIWLDTRGAPYVARLLGGLVSVGGYDPLKALKFVRISGIPPGLAGKDASGHILFIRHERPEIYRATYKFLEPLDYLNLRLTGRFAASYDSIADHTVTDNRDLSQVRYDPDLLRMSDLERSKLPDLLPTASVLGHLTAAAADELGLSTSAQVVTGCGDVHSACIGSGAVLDYQPHIYLGTSAWLLCHQPRKVTDISHGLVAIPAGVPGRYFAGTIQETGGACLNFLRDHLFFADDDLGTGRAPEDFYARLERTAGQAPPGSHDVIFTPWLYGERVPVTDPTVRAGFHNVSLTTSRADLVRAVYEGVAFNLRWGFEPTERLLKRRLDSIRVIGGGGRSALWCQVLADVLDRTTCQMQAPELANMRGAALQAAVALGYLSWQDIPERVPVAATFRPDPAAHKTYDRLFKEFTNLYRQNRGIYARLNRQQG